MNFKKIADTSFKVNNDRIRIQLGANSCLLLGVLKLKNEKKEACLNQRISKSI